MEPMGVSPSGRGEGAIAVGTAGIRKEPDHASEMVSQGVLGETFEILERSADGKWLSVRLDRDGYTGWLRSWFATELPPTHRQKWRDAVHVMEMSEKRRA